MNRFNELLEKLNQLNIIQKVGDWAENIPQDIWDEYFKEFTEVDHNLDVDTHRWYETSISVIKIFDNFLGIKYITNLFSEESDHESCYVKIEFYKMEEYTKTSYRRVK